MVGEKLSQVLCNIGSEPRKVGNDHGKNGKWDVYIGSEEFNTTRFDKLGVSIRKMVIKN
jgi:hypothetical protein